VVFRRALDGMRLSDEAAKGLEAEKNMNIPTYVKVLCRDCGGDHAICIMLNPTTKEVTHIVVKKDALRYVERLIDLGMYDRLVEETLVDQARLN
jgi:hypothetical protein